MSLIYMIDMAICSYPYDANVVKSSLLCYLNTKQGANEPHQAKMAALSLIPPSLKNNLNC